MSKTNVYSPTIQTLIRLISLLAIIILVVSNTVRIETYGIKRLFTVHHEYFTFILNCLTIFLFIGVIIFPTKLGLLSLIPFLYGSLILIFEPRNNMGILMFGLSMLTLYARGFFNKNRKIKNGIMCGIFLCLTLSEIRFGIDVFFNFFVEKIAYSFILLLCLFFFNVYIFDLFETKSKKNKLDIQKFSELKKRDAEWLVEILSGEKYEALAIKYHMSLGSVKNRLKVIFDEIGVGDKQGFVNKYSDYEICYGDEFSSIEKDMNLFNIKSQ
ncbi:MAG: hypothetical protein MJ160_06725 [Treponema sp.]|nr:hypothetical protein [Treponema sp.]